MVILEGCKLGNYLAGGGGEAVLYTVFPSKKNPVSWAMLYVVYVGCVFLSCCCCFFFNGEGRVFVYVAQITHVCLYI